ncbi:FkbM family methyltransferase [Nocardia otitidiscaviarum]|uniref:FkbM family methyltransferase n=1 Tax=Nocardia otitidiscaviarum TaxID=1823 RepID=UPI0018930C5E|nr:FkbM family methyltransferase [Nocardia otitidiscaviarum]MBF6138128.1 FkbM family methyltransferase [Nocardia otitidiscaviarum]
MIRETWCENVYQIHASDFAREGAVCVDIGANIGAVAVYAASFGARVIAVEPEPENRKYLLDNVVDNDVMDRVAIDPDAIWNVAGSGWIKNGHGHSTLEHEPGPDSTRIETITLSDLFVRYDVDECDVLKVDVEGVEYDIIAGTGIDTMRRIRYLTLEFDAAPDEVFGAMVTKIAKTHGVQILGSPERGGYIYARRY